MLVSRLGGMLLIEALSQIEALLQIEVLLLIETLLLIMIAGIYCSTALKKRPLKEPFSD